MEHVRYHLVFQNFKEGVNKTGACFVLKTELNLSDSQIADMMANRRCVLKDNLSKEEAVRLGRQLSQQGLNLKAQALANHQKSSPDELRKQLRDGGLNQFFASRFRHAEDEMDTILSLVTLAALPILTYILLPLIGLLIILPLISIQTWAHQPIAAFFQLIFGLLLFAPATILFPKSKETEGLEIDRETEELFYQLTHELHIYLNAPDIKKVVFIDQPAIKVQQSAKQWLTNQSTLVVGMPLLEALTVQQLIGSLTIELSPFAKPLYQRTWGFFLLWRSAIEQLNDHWADLLDNWVKPMSKHQSERAESIASQLVGLEQKTALMAVQAKFTRVRGDWPAFTEYCQLLNAKPTWESFIVPDQTSSASDSSQATLRFTAPALWILSTTEGYQKAIYRSQNAAMFTMPASTLWQHFQHYIQRQELFFRLGIEPLSLMPTKPAKKTDHGKNAHQLNLQANKVLQCQKERILSTFSKAKPGMCNLKAETLVWQQLSAPFWPKGVDDDKLFSTARTVFQAIQLIHQMNSWLAITRLPESQQKQRAQQIKTLYENWFSLCQKLQPLPVIGTKASSFAAQLANAQCHKLSGSSSLNEISQNLTPWLNLLTVYWVTIAGRLVNTHDN